MDIEYWIERWKEGRTGFHEGKPNAFLTRHVERLGPAPKRILVPLCGKTEDMAFLASRGHHVVGIEAAEQAVRAFFREHDLVPEEKDAGAYRSFSTSCVTILAGDLFACTAEDVGNVDALYDRAALIALGPEVRTKYVAHLRSLLAPRSRALLVTCEYDQSKLEPPPHDVKEAEVRELFAGARIDLVDEGTFDGPKFREAGVSARERCFAIEL